MSSTIENPYPNERRNGKPRAGIDNDPVTLPFVKTPRPKKPRAKPAVKRLSVKRQKEFLDWMIQGASPQVACHQLQVSLEVFWNTLEHDARFAGELQRVWDTLSFNVVAALYQAAIKGNGPAQQFWLKHRPPPRWAAASADQIPTDDMEALSDAELLDRARTEAPDLAAEIAARIAATGSGRAPEDLPGPAEGRDE